MEPSALSPILQHLLRAGMCTENVILLEHQHTDIEKTSVSELRPTSSSGDDCKELIQCKFAEAGTLEFGCDLDFKADVLSSEFIKRHGSRYYEHVLKHLSPLFKQSEELLATMKSDEFSQRYHTLLRWTKDVKLFQEVHSLLAKGESGSTLLSLLMICSGLERALGNLFLLKGSQCPAMLKDLLASQELMEVLGYSPIQVLHVVMGPPTSMNLRNVAWHGFFSDAELPPRYVYFLLLFAASLGKLLDKKGYRASSIPCRDFVSLLSIDDIDFHFAESSGQGLMQSSWDVIFHSWIVHPGNEKLFTTAQQLQKDEEFGRCSMLLLPLLEHTCRRLFVKVNNCPARLITAETTTLFTTFEEILEPTLPDGAENKIIVRLGEPCMDLLHDLLVYPAGPRCRDKLGHGEADHRQVTAGLPRILTVLLAWLAIRGVESSQLQADTPESPLKDYRSIYHPLSLLQQKVVNLAHKNKELNLEISLSPNLESWNISLGFEVFTENDVSLKTVITVLTAFVNSVYVRTRTDNQKLWHNLRDRLTIPFSNYEDHLRQLLQSFKIRTLYRWKDQTTIGESTCTQDIYKNTSKMQSGQAAACSEASHKTASDGSSSRVSSASLVVSESEVVGLLTRVVSEAYTCLEQTRAAVGLRQTQLRQKQLRSRQRENLTRLLSFVPVAGLMSSYIICLTTYIVSNLNNYAALNGGQSKTLQKFLRSSLQCVENLRTYTGPDKNKWAESTVLVLAEINEAGKKIQAKPFFTEATDKSSI